MVWWYIKERSKASVNFKKSNTSQERILLHGLENTRLLFWDSIDFDPSSTYSPRDEANCQRAYLNWIYQEKLYDLLDKYVALKFPDQVTKRREFFNFSPMATFLKKVYVRPSNEVPVPEKDECLPFKLNGFDAGSVPSSPQWRPKMETTQDVLQSSALQKCSDSSNEEELLRNLAEKLLKASASNEQSPQNVTMTPVKIQPAMLTSEKMNLEKAEEMNGFKERPEQQGQTTLPFEYNSPLQQVAEIWCGPSPHRVAQNILPNGNSSTKKQFIPETGNVEQQEPKSAIQFVTADADTSKKHHSISEMSPIAGRVEAEIFFTPNSGSTSKQRSSYYSTESTPKYRVNNTPKHELSKTRPATNHSPEEQQIPYISSNSVRSVNNQNSERKYRDATRQNQSESPCYSNASMEYKRALMKIDEVIQVAQSCYAKTLKTDPPSRLDEIRGIEGIRRTLSYEDIPQRRGEVDLNPVQTGSMNQPEESSISTGKSSEHQISKGEQEELQQESRVEGTIARALQSAMQSLLWLQSFSDKTLNATMVNQTMNGGQLERNAYSAPICSGNNQITGQPYSPTSDGTCNLESKLTVSSILSDPHDKASSSTDLCFESGADFSKEVSFLAHQEHSSLHCTHRKLERRCSSTKVLTASTNNVDEFKTHAERFATDSGKVSKHVEGSNTHNEINPACLEDMNPEFAESSKLHVNGLDANTVPSDRGCVTYNSEGSSGNLHATMPMYIPMDSDRWSTLENQKQNSQTKPTTPHKYSNTGSKTRERKTNGKSSSTPEAFKSKATFGNEKFTPNSSSMLNRLDFPVLGMTPSRSFSHKSTEALAQAPMKYFDTAAAQPVSNNDVVVSAQIIPGHNASRGNGYNSYSSVLKSDPQTDPCLLNPVGIEADHLNVQHSNDQTTLSIAHHEIKSEECKDLFDVPISEEYARNR